MGGAEGAKFHYRKNRHGSETHNRRLYSRKYIAE